MKALLIPFALIFLGISRVRNLFFDLGLLKSYNVGCRVISIGNVTAGGTGKTPITAEIAKILSATGQRVGLISRGYRGTYQGLQKVPVVGADPQVFGDEPSWLATELELPVYVGRSKVEAAQAVCASEKVDWILADDAFQHRRLQRNLDVVVIDGTEPLRNYWPLPAGRARESLTSLKRASLVIINKTNFISSAEREKLVAVLRPLCADQTKIIELGYSLAGFLALKKEGEWESDALQELRVLLVSGLGRPQSFESLARQKAPNFAGHLSFGDHHSYTERDALRISKEARALKVDAIVTTQKDAIKLQKFEFELPVFVTQLSLESVGLTALRREILRLTAR